VELGYRCHRAAWSERSALGELTGTYAEPVADVGAEPSMARVDASTMAV